MGGIQVGILLSHKESRSDVEHKQESRLRPEKDGGGSAHSSWKEAGISRPKGKVFPQYSGKPTALPTREH